MEHKLFIIAMLAILLNDFTNGRTKDPDEDRAYEFGFTIEGMQHRHEKKDVNGIIQGEFGFITADGVYHVTVYATDENGNFRILSMKNIKVSPPLDGSPDYGSSKYSSIPKGPKSQSSSPSLQPVQVQKRTDVSSTRKPNREFTTQPTIKPGCAGCGYVTTSVKPPPSRVTNELYSRNEFPSGQFQKGTSNVAPSAGSFKNYNTNNGGSISSSFSGSGIQKFDGLRDSTKNPKNPSDGTVSSVSSSKSGSDIPQLNNGLVAPFTSNSKPEKESIENRFGVGQQSPFNSNKDQLSYSNGNLNPQKPSYSDSFSNPRNQNDVLGPSKSVEHSSQITYRNPDSPVKVVDGVIKVPGNPDIPIQDKYPGMVEGLPAGIMEKDISDILYRFNWTVGFQGHYETGYKNGAKVGGYFVNGSDGISRVVTYVADEFGYRPKVKIINIGLDSPDTPKDDKTFVLKNFEFVWYPVK